MNHGPEDKGPEGSGPRPDGPADGPDGPEGPDAPGSDELALRRLLHSAVDDIEPSTGTLDHLRRAVPARRARKRQAVVGVAAAALFIGTAIPALVHVSYAGGSDPNTAMAGQSSQAQGGTGRSKDKGGDKGGRKEAGGATAEPGKAPGKHGEKTKGPRTGGGSTGGVNPPATATPGVALCTAAQLGSATGTADAPDTTGVVYGVFRVTNVSGTACTLGGPGTVTSLAQGAADPAKTTSARHVAGDAAAALPDPSLEVSGLILQPGAAYEEKFAFVPSETCPTTGGDSGTGGTDTGEPTPDPTPTQDAGAAGGTTDPGTSVGTTPQLVTEDGTAEGSILVTHTAAPGSPTATATVSGACAGTVYYTGVLAGA
ncbi:hypothetical protein D9753_16445 [Streptomyces dangxiongensis]|uniref:DUF4232 domain-containing protein n=1 Tax=Streptomyces dangxiongensis TaxID=1442032 RepID=A0A3G2JD38_9ACTN|nr:hypothetical protein [Streptomyces dangxiongensis]AYN40240.1 hypothetical protein D9753_16445 [Streptomyces dangxiongensis]